MVKIKQLPRRQRVRKALLFVSLLLFPVTLYYFSPVIIVESAAQGIVNASFIVFGLMFVAALFVGRLWCGWACPAGGLQEFGSLINNKPARGDWIKWAIWIPWIFLIAVLVTRAGGYHAIDPFYHFEGGVTLAQPVEPEGPPWYMIYYIIVLLFLGLALIFGRRASCHTICWMAPFMIIGRRLRNILRWPALRLRVEPERCVDCLACKRNCPMSLDVNRMVRSGDMEDDECILCGTCVDGCQKDVIRFSFSAGR
ncbi:MAG: 4Fe-4S binding protein [Chloroflexota bacterium]|nr:4Fe-4S binding protein [Chloroflexota bacterium]